MYGIRNDFDTRTFDPDRTGTYQLITVINTVANTTSTKVSLVGVYDGFTPPNPTNSDGTAIHKFSYDVDGERQTTTM